MGLNLHVSGKTQQNIFSTLKPGKICKNKNSKKVIQKLLVAISRTPALLQQISIARKIWDIFHDNRCHIKGLKMPMGRKPALLSLHFMSCCSLCHFILSQLLHLKLDISPNSFNTVNTLISQPIYSPDMLSFWYYHYMSDRLLLAANTFGLLRH